jgi:hypothetical protein
LVFRFPRKPCFSVEGIPSRSFTEASSTLLSTLEIPALDPVATPGRLNPAPGGFRVALSEIAGRTLIPETLPLTSFCW